MNSMIELNFPLTLILSDTDRDQHQTYVHTYIYTHKQDCYIYITLN